MQVRVFEAADMASGLKLVKKELGPDALILSTRTIRSGKMGLIGKPILEITAAIDSNAPKETSSTTVPKKNTSHQASHSSGKESSTFRHVVNDPIDSYLGNRDVAMASSPAPSARERVSKPVASLHQQSADLENEVIELKGLVKSLAGQINQLSAKEENQKKDVELKVQTNNAGYRRNSSVIHGDHILSMLIDKGVNVETSRTIAGFLRDSLTDQEQSSSGIIEKSVLSTIENLIQANPPDFANRESQRRIALVGPTGVGKTTTLAKIAALHLSRFSNSIAMITIDTYRIAAVEQLKVYGEIMHLPVDVVITPEQLDRAIDRHRDKDLILIDTAGRSPRDTICIEELSAFLRPDLNIDKHLVLSATTREQELIETITRFQGLGITHTIFTKLDECANLGILLNVQIQNANPLSYLTNGQRVPEDLLEATPLITANMIMSQQEGSMHD